MSLLQSIFLGVVQGLTEFLPVSSSGHLSILQNILRIDTGGSILFDILLHLGTLLVVFIVFRKEILKMLREFFGILADLIRNFFIWRANKKAITLTPYKCVIRNNYRKFVVLVIVSTIPTAIIGLIAKNLVADAVNTLIVPGIGLIITAILLILSDQAEPCTKIPQDVTYREGVIVGIAQGMATLPGLSRSGTTIAACLFRGFDRRFAVMYSFILSIPAVLGAAILEIKDLKYEVINPSLAGIYAAGMIASAIVGYICIRTMLMLVRNRKFRYFAYYCFALGVIAIIGQFMLL